MPGLARSSQEQRGYPRLDNSLGSASRLPEAMRMSKKPKIDHEYRAGKDKMKITIRGYSPSKKTRHAIIEKLMQQLESSPDRLKAAARDDSKKKPHNPQKRSRLIEVGD
jgi:hypothetical protein